MFDVGTKISYTFSYTQAQVDAFAKISGDNNPIHYDEAYAATTPFKKPIIHGIFSVSIFSKYFGTVEPGQGTIYLSQTLEFLRPMYVDTEYIAEFEILEKDTQRHTLKISCKILDNSTKKTTTRGEAMIMHKEKIV